ncbi:MAG TPA: HAD-IA family hydrolase [Nevskia sp.]|nr:HAD-IA family hydrolase [Nevskia sp.]
MFDLFMFDLDGTLVDTAGEIADTVNDVLNELRLPAVSDAQVRGWIGQGSRELLVRACAHAAGRSEAELRDGAAPDSLLEMYARFHERRCGTRSQVYPQVEATLSALQRRDMALAVVSNRERRFAEAVLRAHGLIRYFDPVVAGDTLPVCKPDAQVIEYCLRRHRVPPQRALMVGDSAVDVAAARNAGVRCWAVPYGYNGGRPVEDAAPDRVIPDLSALLAAVQGSRDLSSMLKEQLSWQ